MSSIFSGNGIAPDSKSIASYCTQEQMGKFDSQVVCDIISYVNMMTNGYYDGNINDLARVFEGTGFGIDAEATQQAITEFAYGVLVLTSAPSEIVDEVGAIVENAMPNFMQDQNHQTADQCRYWYLLLNLLIQTNVNPSRGGTLNPAVLSNGLVGMNADAGSFSRDEGLSDNVAYMFVSKGHVCLGIKGETGVSEFSNIILDDTVNIALHRVVYNEGLDLTQYISVSGGYEPFKSGIGVDTVFLGSY